MAKSKYRRIKRDEPIPKKAPTEGFVRFVCPNHGFCVDTFPSSVVWCPCGRPAKPIKEK